MNILLVSLAQSLVGLLSLLFEQLQSSLQCLVLGSVLLSLIGYLFEVLDGSLQLLDLALKEAVLVLQRSNVLLFGQVLLLESLDLGLELLHLGNGLISLQAERVHFLAHAVSPRLPRSV